MNIIPATTISLTSAQIQLRDAIRPLTPMDWEPLDLKARSDRLGDKVGTWGFGDVIHREVSFEPLRTVADLIEAAELPAGSPLLELPALIRAALASAPATGAASPTCTPAPKAPTGQQQSVPTQPVAPKAQSAGTTPRPEGVELAVPLDAKTGTVPLAASDGNAEASVMSTAMQAASAVPQTAAQPTEPVPVQVSVETAPAAPRRRRSQPQPVESATDLALEKLANRPGGRRRSTDTAEVAPTMSTAPQQSVDATPTTASLEGASKEILTVAVTDLIRDPTLQCRVAVDEATVTRYAEDYRLDPDSIPPITCSAEKGSDGMTKYRPVDGEHRIQGTLLAGRNTIRIRLTTATGTQALIEAYHLNRRHGLPLTAADRTKVLARLMADPEYAGLPARQLAKLLACDHKTVTASMEKLKGSSDTTTPRKITVKRGKQNYTLKPRAEKQPNPEVKTDPMHSAPGDVDVATPTRDIILEEPDAPLTGALVEGPLPYELPAGWHVKVYVQRGKPATGMIYFRDGGKIDLPKPEGVQEVTLEQDLYKALLPVMQQAFVYGA